MGERPAGARAGAARARFRALLLAVFVSLGAVESTAADPAPQDVQGRCEIRFFGSSTLHDFSGEVSARPFRLTPHFDAADGRMWWTGSIAVAVADMDTGIERRDRKMRAMFDADRFPHIGADLADVGSAALARARSGVESDFDFSLTIRETRRPVTAKISNWTEAAGRASFEAEFELSLESFGLEVPPVLGLIRVGDAVRVRAQVSLDRVPGVEPETAAFGRSPGPPATGS
jgi:hypothetical protein